jgi:hypothetical protein
MGICRRNRPVCKPSRRHFRQFGQNWAGDSRYVLGDAFWVAPILDDTGLRDGGAGAARAVAVGVVGVSVAASATRQTITVP